MILKLLIFLFFPQIKCYSPKILFFTGGNSLMPGHIYSDFIDKLKIENEVITIKNSDVINQLIEHSQEKEIIPLGHSSGCTTLLNYCSRLKNVKKCILLDPVDNNFNKDYDFYLIKNVLQINAEKSYKWKNYDNFPFSLLKKIKIPKLPFIPICAMNTHNFDNLIKINIKNYGHSDILDLSLSNFMHKTFSEGTNDRDSIDEYKKTIVKIINNYINNNHIYDGISFEVEFKKDKYGKTFELI
jgi:hypothetical protein